VRFFFNFFEYSKISSVVSQKEKKMAKVLNAANLAKLLLSLKLVSVPQISHGQGGLEADWYSVASDLSKLDHVFLNIPDISNFVSPNEFCSYLTISNFSKRLNVDIIATINEVHFRFYLKPGRKIVNIALPNSTLLSISLVTKNSRLVLFTQQPAVHLKSFIDIRGDESWLKKVDEETFVIKACL
jgi:hypothetical protein